LPIANLRGWHPSGISASHGMAGNAATLPYPGWQGGRWRDVGNIIAHIVLKNSGNTS
jgi:hypothetical protein